MSAWGYNLAVIRARWPDIAAIVEAATLEGCAPINGTPSQALSYRDKQITSAFDPLDEAKRQAEHLSRDEEFVYCYGIGLGHLPAVLAARHKTVCVILMNTHIARYALEASEQRWLTAPHVSLAMAEDVDILYVPYAIVPMECRLADAQGHATRDRVFAHMNQRCINEFHFGVNAKRDKEHARQNEAHMKQDKHASALFGTAQGKHAVIVGAGPTLVGELEWLKEAVAADALIVSASTALRLLHENGISPNYAVCIDTDPVQVDHLKNLPDEYMRGIGLVYHPTVFPGFLERWKGERYYYVQVAELHTSGTVMHAVADLAVKLGSSKITMLGCDFCYPNMQSKIPGVFDTEVHKMRPTLLETTDGNGQPTYTDFNLAQYHRHLEDYISQHGQDVRWFKRGKGGVTVRGAEWL